MMAQMQKRTTILAIRMSAIVLLVTLLGSALALLIRKEQSLITMLGYRNKIKHNVIAMRDNSRLLTEQMTAFRRQIRTDHLQRSAEMQLFLRLDQIKTDLKPLEMNVTPVESKDGAHSIGFTLKLPASSYETSINTMGRLQTELFPFVIYKGTSFNAVPGTDFTVEGTVFMPSLTGTKP